MVQLCFAMRRKNLTRGLYRWICVSSLVYPGVLQSATPSVDVASAFLSEHCVRCHSGPSPIGKVPLDKLAAEPSSESAEGAWVSVAEQLRAGRMPPPTEPRPEPGLTDSVLAWIESLSSDTQPLDGRVLFRRLNRAEYENTLRDLLGVDVDLEGLLPDDSSAHGFDNVGEALSVSAPLLEGYLEASDVALRAALSAGPRPASIKKKLFLRDQNGIRRTLLTSFLAQGDSIVMFNSGYSPSTFDRFGAPRSGNYLIRISARAYQSPLRPVIMEVHSGIQVGQRRKTRLVGFHEFIDSGTTVIEFTERLEKGGTIKVAPYGLGRKVSTRGSSPSEYGGPGLAVDWMEIEGPLHSSWPPESRRRLLGANDVTAGDLADAKRILQNFLPWAFRRGVGPDEVEPFLELVGLNLDEGRSFEDSLRIAFQAVLCSPQFLFHREPPGRLDEFALASRLSYFLWSSMPDQELFDLAAGRTLNQPNVLRAQVERMLLDPKAEALTKNFLGQWLSLRDIDFTNPDKRLYPEFDELLKVSMVKETELFFYELLKKDLSIVNFVDSDFTMLNERLAAHYGIGGIRGIKFQRTPLTGDSPRGGVMTHASVMKVTANGTNTSPILRGVWVLDRLLGKPVPPPPAGALVLEPDVRGSTNIRDQVARHRESKACASCHDAIDPIGFALENFDAIGGWRQRYRTTDSGERVLLEVDGRRVRYRHGPSVVAKGKLPDGRKFSDIAGLQRLLLQDKEEFIRSFTARLVTYATGGLVGRTDADEIDRVVDATQKRDYGMRSLIHEIVQSRLFLYK